MTIWLEAEQNWNVLSPHGFTDEDALHTVIERAPQLLPLAGDPQLTVVGREVRLGGGRADLVAIDTHAQLSVVEIKLRTNAESRRAVISQVLAYAAALHQLTIDQVQREILRDHLRTRGFGSLYEAAHSAGQPKEYEAAEFEAMVAESLALGAFRLVVVLDDVPPELVRLSGYLTAISDRIKLDLIVVSAYSVGGSRIVVPRRIDPAREEPADSATPTEVKSTAQTIEGGQPFFDAIAQAADEHRAGLLQLYGWASHLESEGLVRLQTYFGKRGEITLLPRLQPELAGLVTVWNWPGQGAFLSVYRSVFDRRAPEFTEPVEQLIAPLKLGQGNTVSAVTPQLLDALTAAYRAAASTC
ncbi:MAG TPA: hypothetical protein VGL75_08775 [Acidothermaceae bacterium]